MRGDVFLWVSRALAFFALASFVTALPVLAQGELVANAGRDRAVSPGTAVVLDGRGSHGDQITFTWRQLSGPSVVLQQATSPTPSFTAPKQTGAVVMLLAVRDAAGRSMTDVVTITVQLPAAGQLAARLVLAPEPEGQISGRLTRYAGPINTGLFFVSLLLLFSSLVERVGRWVARLRWPRRHGRRRAEGGVSQQLIRVVDARSGGVLERVRIVVRQAGSNAQVGARADRHGVVQLSLPPGAYLVGLAQPAYTIAPGISPDFLQEGEGAYIGDYLEVRGDETELRVVLPVQPTEGEALSLLTSWRLRGWQFLQRQGHAWAWVLLVAGALLNTGFLLIWPQVSWLAIEVGYICLVGVKLVLETRARPSAGLVRDAVTHLPIDLAVVRFYERDSGRLVMTRVTDGQGKFFALPPRGIYTVTVVRDGYAVYQQREVLVHGRSDTAVHVLAELSPLVAGSLAEQQRP